MIDEIDLMSYLYPTFKFKKDHTIRLFEAFSGFGCQRLALKRVTDNYESVGISEIDKYAIQSYKAIHGDCNNYGSICDIHELPPKIDIFTWSFPCTDLSKAGKQEGLKSNLKGQEQTRSGLCYEVLRVLHENVGNQPKVLICENVIDLIQDKFIREFNEIQSEIENMGYQNYTFTMDASDYGIPQSRQRVFMVSILSDYQPYYYEPPKRIPLTKYTQDYLEDNVEGYTLSHRQLRYILDWQDVALSSGRDINNRVINPRIAKTISCRGAADQRADVTNFVIEGHKEEMKVKNVKDMLKKDINCLKLRRLTPRECGRLMGVYDEDITKLLSVTSDAQAYKQFGNGIVIDCFYYIIKNLIEA